MGMEHKPLCQFPDMGLWIVCVGVVVGIHDLVFDCDGASVVHVIRNIVEVEEPVYVVTTHPQLMEGHCRVSYASEFWRATK